MIRVLIEASSPALYAQLAALVRDDAELRVVGGAFDPHAGEENRDEENQPRPDVVVLAWEGFEGDGEAPAFESFGWSATGVPLIVVADGPPRRLSERAGAEVLPGGVRALLPRNVTAAELAAAVEAVAAGLFVIHPAEAEALPGSRARPAEAVPEGLEPLVEPLTQREIEVLQLLSAGLGNKEIASRLDISEHTAKFHVASILGKLGAASRTEAVTLGIRRGLVMI